jgi:hypothetical protein
LVAQWGATDGRGFLMNDPAVKRGGIGGAAIMIFYALVISLISYAENARNHSDEPVNGIYYYFLFFVLSFLLGMLGCCAGGWGAECQNVFRAFFFGGFIFAILPVILVSCIYYFSASAERIPNYLLCAVALIALFSSSGALVSGLGAILARDYRKFQKKRIIPQFTLQELFVICSLVVVITSVITCYLNWV